MYTDHFYIAVEAGFYAVSGSFHEVRLVLRWVTAMLVFEHDLVNITIAAK